MNQVCRLWHAHMKHPSPLLTDGQGRLSLEKLCNEDPEYHRAVSQGMEWQIISHLVPKEFPEFCDLVFDVYVVKVSGGFVFSSCLTPKCHCKSCWVKSRMMHLSGIARGALVAS